jgi:hypothetical protein
MCLIKRAFVGEKKNFERYQNARNNNKNYLHVNTFSGICVIWAVTWQGRISLCLPHGLTIRTAACCTQLRKHLVLVTQQTSAVSPDNLKQMLSVTVLECVYCEVRTEHTCVTYTRPFWTGDPHSIPSQDMWDILCTSWQWTAIILFSPVSAILPMHDVRPRPNAAAAIWGTKERSLQWFAKGGRQVSRSSPVPSKMSVYWLVSWLDR